jgi:hypothetical protein
VFDEKTHSQQDQTRRRYPGRILLRAAIGVILVATDTEMRTLYPIGADGAPDTSQPGMVATLGIAVYVAGAGVAVAAIGSLMFRQGTQRYPDALDRRRPHPQERDAGGTNNFGCGWGPFFMARKRRAHSRYRSWELAHSRDRTQA